MNPTTEAVIVVRRPTSFFVGGLRSFVVWIDGRRAGQVKRGVPAEFTIGPGQHVVAVTMDWFKSRALHVLLTPGSTTELVIGVRSGVLLKFFLPILLAVLATMAIIEGLRRTTSVVDHNWLVRCTLFVVVYGVIMTGYLLVTSKLFADYWAILTLEPTGSGTERIGG